MMIPIINVMRQYLIDLVKACILPLRPIVTCTNVAWMCFDEEPLVEYNLWHKEMDMLQSAYEYRILPLV